MAGRQCFPSLQSPVPSFDGKYIAVINDLGLSIRLTVNGDEIQSYVLPPGFAHSCRFIRWYPTRAGEATTGSDWNNVSHDSGRSSQLLLADDAKIVVYDVTKPQAYAEITGATSLTKLASIDFGYTPDEIIVLSDFGWKLQIWSLTTKRAVEIKDPKSVASSYSYRPRTGHLALLTRPAAHDFLLIMAPDSHEILSTWELATIDARGVKYSPDVWQEEIGPSLGRRYAEARQPAVSPSQEHFPTSKEKLVGVGPMKFNVDGTLLASKSSATPSTVWIHSLETGRTLTALIHHSPITLLRWHHAIHDLLLLQCATPEPTVYLWKANWPNPRIYNLPLKAPMGQSKASWLSSTENTISFMLSNANQTAIERLTLDGETTNWQGDGNGLGPEAMFDEGNSLDLSPVRSSGDGAYPNETTTLGLSTQLGHSLDIEDTFQFRRHGQAVT
ncbi:MAG: hypothetical protein Q9203_007063 [Teloschistes exilis]